jgi:hypothetical protein
MNTLFKAIKYPFRKIKEAIVWTLKKVRRNKIKSNFFKKCKFNNVTIQKRAHLSCVQGIEIGENSIIYDSSIICALKNHSLKKKRVCSKDGSITETLFSQRKSNSLEDVSDSDSTFMI